MVEYFIRKNPSIYYKFVLLLFLFPVDNTYELLVSAIQEDYAVVPLPMGSTYQLLASAIDNVGNRMDIEEHNIFEVTFPFVEGKNSKIINIPLKFNKTFF